MAVVVDTPLQHCIIIRDSAFGVADKGDQRVWYNYQGITFLSLPGKVYSRVLERRVQLLDEPRIQEEQCDFRPGSGTMDQLYTLAGGDEILPNQSTCVLWIWRRFVIYVYVVR